jgi:hypothetical protein
MATIPASATFGSYQPLTGRNTGIVVPPGAVSASPCYPTNYGFYRLASTGPARLNIPTAYAQFENGQLPQADPIPFSFTAPKGLMPTGSPPLGPNGLWSGLYVAGGA